MKNVDRVLNRLFIIFIYVGIGQLIANFFGKIELSTTVLIEYLVVLPISIIFAVINTKRLKKKI